MLNGVVAFWVILLIMILGQISLPNVNSFTNETCLIQSNLSVSSHGVSNGNTVSRIFDGDFTSFWHASSNSSTIVVDLSKKERVCSIDIYWYAQNLPHRFQVSASSVSDGRFSEVYVGDSATNTSGLERYDFQDFDARYLNITFLPNGNSLPAVAEISIYTYKHSFKNSRLPELPVLPLYDNFDNKTKSDNKWIVEYTGHGFAGRIKEKGYGGIYRMYPITSTYAEETHAALVTSADRFSDFRLSLDARTDSQLRENSAAKKWEVGWVFCRYTDTFHYYWFSLKPNGFELGKKDCNSCKDPVDGQVIL